MYMVTRRNHFLLSMTVVFFTFGLVEILLSMNCGAETTYIKRSYRSVHLLGTRHGSKGRSGRFRKNVLSKPKGTASLT